MDEAGAADSKMREALITENSPLHREISAELEAFCEKYGKIIDIYWQKKGNQE